MLDGARAAKGKALPNAAGVLWRVQKDQDTLVQGDFYTAEEQHFNVISFFHDKMPGLRFGVMSYDS